MKNEVIKREKEKKEIEKNELQLGVTALGNKVIKTSSGPITCNLISVKLEASKGHLELIKKKVMITVEGFLHLNRFIDITFITPPTLMLNGKVKENPYDLVINNEWIGKAMRMVGIARSPSGFIIPVDECLSYIPKNYLIQDIIRKIDGQKDAGSLCNLKYTEEDENTRVIVLDEYTGLKINLRHPDIFKAYKTYRDKVLNAEKILTSVLKRRIGLSHPIIGQRYVEPIVKKNGKYTDYEIPKEASIKLVNFQRQLTSSDLKEAFNSLKQTIGPKDDISSTELELIQEDDEDNKEENPLEIKTEEKPEKEIPDKTKKNESSSKKIKENKNQLLLNVESGIYNELTVSQIKKMNDEEINNAYRKMEKYLNE